MCTHKYLWVCVFLPKYKPNVSHVDYLPAFLPLHISYHHGSPELGSKIGKLRCFLGHKVLMCVSKPGLIVDRYVPVAKKLKDFYIVSLSPQISRPPSWSPWFLPCNLQNSPSHVTPLWTSSPTRNKRFNAWPSGHPGFALCQVSHHSEWSEPRICAIVITKYFNAPLAKTSLDMSLDGENHIFCNFHQGDHCMELEGIVLKPLRWKIE